jgi:hypothetical protein
MQRNCVAQERCLIAIHVFITSSYGGFYAFKGLESVEVLESPPYRGVTVLLVS